ncbi:MAG: methylated-DNA--[protein]-cysteine S-methyltransferase [Actinomycetota bacterium]|nr:methylated-DNA--[protein]-cysteine S-methyltransferase [Actinomycetota bacterium]MDP2289458.1 methylated-DNA--[protein]-cysteine S-methyltransferase [Actinomycetota bacterium]
MTSDAHVIEAIESVTKTDQATLDRLHASLAALSSIEGLLDASYSFMESPIGKLMLVSTDVGLIKVAFENEDFDKVLMDLGERIGPRLLHAPERLAPVERELRQYFDGERTDFDLTLDLSLTRGFRQVVQLHLVDIGYGMTRSYKEVAASVGNPNATRAVGSACATNPLPIVLPCHRVLRSDGSLGGYAGGLDAKRTLLALERAA